MNRSLNNLSTLDIFLSGLSQIQYDKLKLQFGVPDLMAMPLLSWDLFMLGNQAHAAKHMMKADLERVQTFAKKFKWHNDLEAAFNENDYEALIITDKNQNIIWVNEGFTKMTGYAKKDALNKTPRFLQGEKTSVQTKKRIKSKLALDKPFQEVIINHRKDNSTYKCEVKIFPLYNEETTHYIAFEKLVG